MSQGKRAQKARCSDCRKLALTADITSSGQCLLCADQLVLSFPPVRDSRGRFVAAGGAR